MKMKRITALLLTLIFIWIGLNECSASGLVEPIKVILNGNELNMDVQPIILNNRTLVPFRAIFEAMKVSVEWDESSKSIIAKTETKKGNIIKYIGLTIGSTNAYISNYGAKAHLEVPPIIKDGRTFVPLRFIAEALDMNVTWDEAKKTVYVSNKQFSLDKNGYIIKSLENNTQKSDNCYIEMHDYGNDFTYLVAVGEDKHLYTVNKSDFNSRKISVGANYPYYLYFTAIYKGKFFYCDTSIVKETDGTKEIEYSEGSNVVKIANRLYFTDSLHGIKYIDMDIDKEFIVNSESSPQIMYISKDLMLYVESSLMNLSEERLILRTIDKGNNDEESTLGILSAGSLINNDFSKAENDVYSNPSYISTSDYFIYYDMHAGIYSINLAKRSITKISDIIPDTIYYANNRIYLIKNSEVGYIDIKTNDYKKIFSKSNAITGYKKDIVNIDEEGNITFTVTKQVQQQHCDIYTYKYLSKENKLFLFQYIPWKSLDEHAMETKKLLGKLMDVD